jgi:hypothetical protein
VRADLGEALRRNVRLMTGIFVIERKSHNCFIDEEALLVLEKGHVKG